MRSDNPDGASARPPALAATGKRFEKWDAAIKLDPTVAEAFNNRAKVQLIVDRYVAPRKVFALPMCRPSSFGCFARGRRQGCVDQLCRSEVALPTWVALKHVPDWRWLLDRDDTPWYPTLRLFRQQTIGDWNSVFSKMERELRSLVP